MYDHLRPGKGVDIRVLSKLRDSRPPRLAEVAVTGAHRGGRQARAGDGIRLDYAIATDGAGRADRNADLAVTALHLPGAAGAGRVERLTVEVSYDDGRQWHRLDLRHGRYALEAPRGTAFVSLRASARDTEG